MKRLLLLLVGTLLTLTGFAQNVILVEKGNVESLLNALKEAARRNSDRQAERLFILIPDGYYDLGETTLTRVEGNNIAIIGESMEGTVIRNAPDAKTESISHTAVLVNRGTGNYYQDLTLRNDLDYYACNAAGRAVTLQDKGSQTICNRIRLLSYQDTYYSDNDGSQHYFQDSEIHGTVDFICGAGDVWFERCRIVTEKRSVDGGGRCVIAAPKTLKTPWGYIFNRCTVENIVSDFQYARGWNGTPHCIWLHTTLLSPEKLLPTRFDERGMRTVQNDFKEFGTMDVHGKDITPASNRVTFTMKEAANTVETILTDEEARRYTIKKVFTSWNPVKTLKQTEKKARKLKARHLQ